MKILFSDIDGTLLDHNTYSYTASLRGLNILKKHNILLVPVSSKTYDEMLALNRELSPDSPFIFEGGGGAGLPPLWTGGNEYTKIIYGTPKHELTDSLELICRITDISIKPLESMKTGEIIRFTGLSSEGAALARKRLTSIPFIASHDLPELNHINTILKKYNTAVTKGGRFYHLSGITSNKGNAVRKMIENIKIHYKTDAIVTAAAGDSENDLPMLKAVDYPFLVRKPDGSVINHKSGRIHVTAESGPAGFSEAAELFAGI